MLYVIVWWLKKIRIKFKKYCVGIYSGGSDGLFVLQVPSIF